LRVTFLPTPYLCQNYPLNKLLIGCLMPPSTMFQLFRGGRFYWWRKQEYPEKTILEG